MPHVLQPPVPRERVNSPVLPINQAVQETTKKQNHQGEGGGAPERIDEPLTQQLTALFQMGWSERKACEYVGISTNTLLSKKKRDEKFLRQITLAKARHLLLAGDRVTQVLEKGSDRDALPIAKWIYEKRMPEMYGNVTIEQQNNQQNNIYVLNNQQLSDIRQQPDLSKTSPAELLETLEDRSQLDASTEEGGSASLHSEEIQGEYTDSSDMSQPPSSI